MNRSNPSPPRATPTSLVRCTRGLSSVEYIILLVVIGVASIATWNEIGGKVFQHASDSNEALDELENPS